MFILDGNTLSEHSRVSLPLCGYHFTLLHKLVILMKFTLSIFSFACTFGVISNKSLPNPMS